MDNGNYAKTDAIPSLQLFNCVHPDCAATFVREWRLKEHETIHTGARPLQCQEQGCSRRFSRKSHLTRHKLSHRGEKTLRCTYLNCARRFFSKDNLKRHVRYNHDDKDKYFKCHFQDCALTFRKRKAYKTHLATHGIASNFKCLKEGCGAKFETAAARRSHEKTHAGYPCPQPGCQMVARTWGKLQEHLLEHPSATHTCKECPKKFKNRAALRSHRRSHAAQKPVLMCPSDGCQACFSTTFNLQHHIRKVHLQLLKHRCYFPGCTRTFAMQESLHRHILHHGPDAGKLKQKRQRSSKSWQKRLERRHQPPLVEDDLRRLFTQQMSFPRRGKLEANLSCLFNERKIPRHVDPEVNLRDLFSLKPPRPLRSEALIPLPTC
ncbi:P43 5S RNA-binding protein-like isoform X2 [Anguilla anguilla]|uniref:P43 5S RNA-binding protein-like isoform X2 n=1 Tax=Anguilla anguilla TaxID=7936 RepID=UPI0015A90B05|nr:P43 5S RNA-binding protein-like isoform X2 [Anguilla anguilla]